MMSRHRDRGWQRFRWPLKSETRRGRASLDLWLHGIGVCLVCVAACVLVVGVLRVAIARQDALDAAAAAQRAEMAAAHRAATEVRP